MLEIDELKAGITIENRYRLIQQLGDGGFAVVWEVEDIQANCDRKAIKFLKRQDTAATKLFRNEFWTLDSLKCDRIIKVQPHSLYPEQEPEEDDYQLRFFVMEKVEGKTLEQLIEESAIESNNQKLSFIKSIWQFLFCRYPPLRSRITYFQIGNWLEQITEALEYIHSEKIIHCDIKPANIIITPNGDIKLIDFGVATQTNGREYAIEFDSRSQVGGWTPNYAAPEQKNKQVLLASDFYSLGLMILSILTGQQPPPEIDESKLRSQFPPELTAFLVRATQNDHTQRYLNAKDLHIAAIDVARSLRRKYSQWNGLRQVVKVLGTAAIATTCTLLIRAVGMLQTWEFAAYDQMLVMRPNLKQESPILIIAIRDQQNISDRDLATVISNILPDNPSDYPSLISVGIKRDENVDHTGQHDLENLFRKNSNIFGSCEYNSENSKGFDFVPKPTTPLGFGNNLFYQSRDEVRRIHLLMYKNIPQDRCTANVSSSLLLANYYLYNSYANLNRAEIISSNEYTFGKAKLHNLEIGQAAYQERGRNSFNNSFQILLDYHSFEMPQKESFADVLKRKLPAEKVRGKIILIGRDDRGLSNSKDLTQLTPYGAMSAIELRSHMISHLISVAMGERPVLHPANFSLDLFWIIAIATLSGFFCWRIPNSIGKVILIIVLPVALYGGCFLLLLTQGLWLGFIPIAIASTSANVAIFLCFRQKKFDGL